MNEVISKKIGEKEQTTRIAWVDVARGIAFLAVIYSHLKSSCEPMYVSRIDILLRPMFLTTFFFVSGYLFKSGRSFSSVFEQRTRTLLWPLLSLGSIMIVLQHIFTFRDAPLSWADGFKGLLLQNGENEILWFIAALYIYSLAFYWIERFSKQHILVVSLGLFVLNWLYGYILNGPNLPWNISAMGYGCAYMGMGRWYRIHESEYKTVKTYITIGGILVLWIVLEIMGDAPSFFASEYLVDALLITVVALILTVAFSKIPQVSRDKFLVFIGANSLFYFAFHGKVLALVSVITMKLLNILPISPVLLAIMGVICTILCALILVPFAMVVNKYLPWLLGKGFKLWKTKKQ